MPLPSQPRMSVQPQQPQAAGNSLENNPLHGITESSVTEFGAQDIGYQPGEASNTYTGDAPIGQNIDSASAYQQSILSNVGINSLRPEIVATTEFVPLAEDDNQFTTNSNYTLRFGDNYQIEATGLTRLLEKQLILQQTVAKNVEKFISIAAGFSIDDFLRTVKAALVNEDIPLGDIQSMKNTIVTRLQNLDVANVSNTVQVVSQTSRNAPSPSMSPNQITQATRAEVVEQRQDFSDLKKIVDLFDSPYADLAFEYVGRDIFISKAIEFINGLIALKLKLARSLDIGNCDVSQNLEINDQLISAITDKTQIGSTGEKPNVDFSDFQSYYLKFVALRNSVSADTESIILNQSGTKKLLTILKALTADILMEKTPSDDGRPRLEDLTDTNKIPSFTNSRGEFENLKNLDAINLYFLNESKNNPFGITENFESTFDLKVKQAYKDQKAINLFVYSLIDFVYANNFNGKSTFESVNGIRGFDGQDYNNDNITLSSLTSKLFGFPTPTSGTETVNRYVFEPIDNVNDSISKRIVNKIPFDTQGTDVVPLENNYFDLESNIPFEKGQNFFVDKSLQQNDFNFTDLASYTSFYADKVNSITNDYLRLHGRQQAQAVSTEIDFEFAFKKFRNLIADYISNRFIDDAPTSGQAYAFSILMTAAKDIELANLIFRNTLYYVYLDLAGVGDGTAANIESAGSTSDDENRRGLYKLQTKHNLRNQIHFKVCERLFGIDSDKITYFSDDTPIIGFQDKDVPERTGASANIGSFPDSEDSYESDYAVKRSVLVTNTVAHNAGSGSGERKDFQDAFDEIIKIIKKLFRLDRDNVLDIISTYTGESFLKEVFANDVDTFNTQTGESTISGPIPEDDSDLFLSIFGSEFKKRTGGIAGKSLQLKRSGNTDDTDRFTNYNRTRFGVLRKSLNTSYLGRSYSYYLLFLRMIFKSLSCKATIRKTGGNNSKREFNLHYSKTQFMGFVDGLRRVNNRETIVDSLSGNPISPSEAAAVSEELGQFGVNVSTFPLKLSSFYETGLRNIYIQTSIVEDKYNLHFVGGVNHLLIMATHVNALKKNTEALKNYLDPNEQQESDQRQIVNYYTSNQNGSNIASILTDEQIRAVRASQLKLFKPAAENATLPSNQQFSHPQIKNMIKYLTQPGFGYLNSEKSGRKTVLNVGIPIGLIERLRRLSRRSTGDDAYEKSNIVAIFVHRQNLLNPKEIVYPKTFLFDMSRFVIENPDVAIIDNTHITDFVDDQIVNALIKKHVMYKVNAGGLGSAAINKRVGTAYKNASGDNRYTSELKESIFINHLTDHYLKLYNRIITGIDLQEHTFQLLDDYNLQGLTADSNKQSLFNGDLKDKTLLLFPDASKDIAVAREYFRLHRGASNSFLFKSQGYMDAVLQGKVFDRVFSLMVNERDFIMHPDSFQPNGSGIDVPNVPVRIGEQPFFIESFDQIYDRVPTFNTRGKLQLGNATVKEQIQNQYPVLRTYSDSLNPESTQIYNYTVEISLLKGMIEEND